jgi:hypothetical protein
MANRPLTVKRESYRPSIRMLNAGASVANTLGLPFGCLEETSLLDAARRMTGLHDFGGDHFMEPFRHLLADVQDRGITSLAHFSTRDLAIVGLTNRLRLTEKFKQNPGLNDWPIKRPVFILGFPRTGTTLLQNLLALDPHRRALPFWEIMTPVPVSTDPVKDMHARIKAVNQKLSLAYFVVPEMEFVHEIRAESLEECWPMFANCFTVMNWDMASHWSTYGEWLLDYNMVPAYQEYKQCLQLLAQRKPESGFVLKCPDHLWFVDALLEVFPDACIVWTHRDPVDSIASYCSLISLNWRLLYGRYDPEEIGAHITQRFLQGIQRAMAVRERVGAERFFDVDFVSLVNDPLKVVTEITAHFDLAEIPKTSMDQYMQIKRADARGQHVYSVPRYGLDADQVHGVYQDYIDRFQIPVRSTAARNAKSS